MKNIDSSTAALDAAIKSKLEKVRKAIQIKEEIAQKITEFNNLAEELQFNKLILADKLLADALYSQPEPPASGWSSSTRACEGYNSPVEEVYTAGWSSSTQECEGWYRENGQLKKRSY